MTPHVRLPRSATRRNAPSWAWLLERVDPHATTALDFYGRIMTPGAIINEIELWPTENYPAVPILLECCQIVFSGRGHHKNPLEHIIWIYSQKKREWRQIAHVSAHRPEEWIPPIAAVAAKYVHPRVIPPTPDLHQAARRIASVIELELFSLPDNVHRRDLLQTAVDYLALRNADIGATRKTYQMPLRSDDYFSQLELPTNPLNTGWSLRERMAEGEGPARLGM
jgi:hypothetical protein